MQSQMRIADPTLSNVMNVCIFNREFSTSLAQVMYQSMQGQGIWQFTVMQSLTAGLQAGAQYTYINNPMMGGGAFNPMMLSWAALYQTGAKNKHQFAMAYVPQQQAEALSLSYFGKLSPRLTLFSEMKMGLGSNFMTGFRLRFPAASVTGYVDSKLKTYATYSKSLEEGALNLSFDSMVDFKSARKNCKFGM